MVIKLNMNSISFYCVRQQHFPWANTGFRYKLRSHWQSLIKLTHEGVSLPPTSSQISVILLLVFAIEVTEILYSK